MFTTGLQSFYGTSPTVASLHVLRLRLGELESFLSTQVEEPVVEVASGVLSS